MLLVKFVYRGYVSVIYSKWRIKLSLLFDDVVQGQSQHIIEIGEAKCIMNYSRCEFKQDGK